MDDEQIDLVTKAAAAAAEAAARRIAQPVMRPATVAFYDPATLTASVVVDGDAEQTSTSVIVGSPLESGDRVMVTFMPPSAAFVTGIIGMARAVVGQWAAGSNTTIAANGFAYLSIGAAYNVSYPNAWDVAGPAVSAIYTGWYQVTASVSGVGTQPMTVALVSYVDGLSIQHNPHYGTRAVTTGGTVYLDGPGSTLRVFCQNNGSSQTFMLSQLSLAYLGA